MISSEQAEKFLKQHHRSEITPKHFAGLSQPYQILGGIILHRSNNTHKKTDHQLFVDAFNEQPSFNPWRSQEGAKLGVILYGAPKAHLVSAVWDLTLTLPYQNGYVRRPFRREPKANPLNRRLGRMRDLYTTGKLGFSGLDVFQTAQYSGYYQWQATQMALWFTAGLNDPATADKLRTLLADITAGEDEIGLVNRGLLMGLLTTDDHRNWKLVEQLLLAAQRQEGLRQTILESLDETSIGALKHFLGVILENKLARFSAVVRAVDTWFGFGWEAPKQATINRVLTLARGFLQSPETVEAGLTDKDSLTAYVALWSVAVVNVDDALKLAVGLLHGEDRIKKLIALNFISQTGLSKNEVGTFIENHLGKDLELDYWLLMVPPDGMTFTGGIFERLLHYGETLPKDGKKFAGTVFSWQVVNPTPSYFYDFMIRWADKKQLHRLCKDITKLPSEAREQLMRRVFPEQYSYSLSYAAQIKKDKAEEAAAEGWKRDLIRQAATDRNGSVMATGVRFLGVLELEEDDQNLIIDLLRRKGKELRAELIKVILGQDEGTLKTMITRLLAGKNVDQRLAGLEVMTVLYEKDKLTTYVLAQHGRYRERTKFSKNEEVLLAKFDAPLEDEISYANGFRVIDHTRLTPLVTPELQFAKDQAAGLTGRLKEAAQSIVNRTTGSTPAFLFPELVDGKKLTAALNDLFGLLRQHGKLEYTMWYNDDYSQVVLLENALGLTDPKAFGLSAREKLDYLPLPDVWRGWYERAGLNDFELLFSVAALQRDDYQQLTGPFEPFMKQYAIEVPDDGLPGTPNEKVNSRDRLASVLGFFLEAFGDKPTIFQFQVDLLEDMIARLPADLQKVVTVKNRWGHDSNIYWTNHLQGAVPGNLTNLTMVGLADKDPAVVKRLWNLKMYLMARTLVQGKVESRVGEVAAVNPGRNNNYPIPGIWITLFLHERGLITDDDLLLQSLHFPKLFQLLNGDRKILRWQKQEDLVVPEHLMAPLRRSMLDLELQRGDLPSDATPYVDQLIILEGMDYVFRTLERLGKENLHRGYAWGRETSKKVSFSGILKKSSAAATDTAPAFIARAKSSSISRKRWFEVAMYAPQWTPWIAELLNIADLGIAVWWFHAHASDYMSGHKEKIVAQLSPIAGEDFARGAIDVDWFYAAYQGVGKKNWKELHDAAKYISGGNGHRQVKTYSAVMLGEIKITETLKRIKEKRDQVYVKALGLVPFSRSRPEKDLLRRYKLLQDFIRESRQFGAQRQESEKTAARIGLENLARNAGYDDVTRFGWIMEAETTRDILESGLVGIDNVTVQLFVDENGKADIAVTKDGKPQKTIPAKLRKNKYIAALKENKTTLRRQFSRTRTSLENAMLSGVIFTPDDLVKIMAHPIVRPLLSKLVLYVPEHGYTGFWKEDRLIGIDGVAHPLAADDQLVIAHPAHLYRAVQWDLYQRFAFDNELVQPFKQIFRELYLVTNEEKELAIKSVRYQGHQIQPRKAAALLRTRGWTVSDSEGLQRVYHKQDVVATMYAMADWYSPADVEAPVIESIVFHNRRGETLKLADLDPVLFSEVMRDIDLVVSVAHVGGVDPEASHSTLQMRAALARESARLFKAENVEVKQRHIVIAGKHGSYNIHLGSGMVSKGGLQLNIIAVQSQHRGRLFLPFLDDDPKSAEIISKMKLLAEDDRIKDPTVLGQILN